jgi:hypothetical protein
MKEPDNKDYYCWECGLSDNKFDKKTGTYVIRRNTKCNKCGKIRELFKRVYKYG